MPHVISRLLRSLDNPDIPAGKLAELIEKDQALTSRVLKVANSPFYGFSRRISTVELAIVIMGLNSIKEIVISLIVRKLFARGGGNIDPKQFWEYSLFCGAAARLIARKIGYPLAGEAFVAGLIHDLGIIATARILTKESSEIWHLATARDIPLTEAEQYVLGDTHAAIGAWIAEKWRLPDHLCAAVAEHHQPLDGSEGKESVAPLSAIVSLAEWFAFEMDMCPWYPNQQRPQFYLEGSIITEMTSDGQMTSKGAIESLKQEIKTEFERASAFNDVGSESRSLYKHS